MGRKYFFFVVFFSRGPLSVSQFLLFLTFKPPRVVWSWAAFKLINLIKQGNRMTAVLYLFHVRTVRIGHLLAILQFSRIEQEIGDDQGIVYIGLLFRQLTDQKITSSLEQSSQINIESDFFPLSKLSGELVFRIRFSTSSS